MARRSSRLRAGRSIECTITASPSRTKPSRASSCGRCAFLARGVIGEQPVQCDAVELPAGILVEAADTAIAGPLTADDAHPTRSVRLKPETLNGKCQSITVAALI